MFSVGGKSRKVDKISLPGKVGWDENKKVSQYFVFLVFTPSCKNYCSGANTPSSSCLPTLVENTMNKYTLWLNFLI